MLISIASGKGGTGKTFVATSLALSASLRGEKVQLLDCDVEEPNSHIFIKPVNSGTESVGVPVPEVDEAKCNGCGKCGEVCQYAAIVVINKKVLTFPELCHGCGGCMEFCPENAITETPRAVGVMEAGKNRGVDFVHGRLRVGEAMSPPLIKKVKSMVKPGMLNIIDSPPGTSCPVIESVRGSDFVFLVTEPTPFGLNDLKLAVEMVRKLGLLFAVGINRCDLGDRKVYDYCEKEEIPILLEIPNDRRIAEVYSRGELVVIELPEFVGKFKVLLDEIKRRVRERGAA